MYNNNFDGFRKYLLGFAYFRISIEVVSWMAMATNNTSWYSIDTVLESTVWATFCKYMYTYL